jgi:hypothetical protein
MGDSPVTRHITAAALLLLVAGAAPAADYVNNYTAGTGYIEHVIMFPSKVKSVQDLGAGWPDAEELTPGTGYVTAYAFSPTAVEAYYGTWHPLHHATRTGQCYLDLHYTMSSAHAGTVRMTASFWKVTAGTNLASIGAPTVTTSWTIDPRDTALYSDHNFFALGYSGAVAGGQVGQISMTTLGLTSIQDEVFYLLQRDATDGTHDTHTGDLDLLRFEAHYAANPYVLSVGE